MREIPRLTDLEIKVMKVLWEHEDSMTIQEIAAYLVDDNLSVASVTQAVKHLRAKKAVEVSEHVLVASVYARTFLPCFTQEEFLSAEYKRLQKSVFGIKKSNSLGIVATLLSDNDDEEVDIKEIEKLQKLIDRKIEQLKEKEG